MKPSTTKDCKDTNQTKNNVKVQEEKIIELFSSNVKRIYREKGLSYSKIAKRGDISEEAIKKLISNKQSVNPQLKTIARLAFAFDVPVMELLDSDMQLNSMYSNQIDSFSQYIAEYNSFFYSLKKGGGLLKGKFSIHRSPVNNNSLEACLCIPSLNHTELFSGSICIVSPSNSAYAILSNPTTSNIYIISFKIDILSAGNTILGLLLSFDNEGLPSVQRFLCIKKHLEKVDCTNIIRGQLRMNTEIIFLTRKQIDTICDNSDIPQNTKRALQQIKNRRRASACYAINETELEFPNQNTKNKVISHIRSFSNAPKIYRISGVIQKFLENLFESNIQNEEDHQE